MAGKRIDEHTLRVLEFEDVKNILASFAASDLGRDARALSFGRSAMGEGPRVAETTELAAVVERGERVPMAGLRDIRSTLKEFGKKQTVLEPAQLLEISDTLAASGRLRLFLTNLEPSQSGHLYAMGEKLGDFQPIVDEIGRCIGGDKRAR
jgi:DNA mismatch repair protein MutS2